MAGQTFHEKIEQNVPLMVVLVILVISVAGLIEIVPLFFQRSTTEPVAGLKPYTALQLEGRDVYIREGCYNCHSQMIRPFRSETERYGEYSKAGEFVYDHPFQWGSKRTGPDLAREGVMTGKIYKPDAWHFNHMLDPQKLNENSIMPKYPWLIEDDLDLSDLPAKIRAMQTLGVPYPEGYDEKAVEDYMKQADKIVAGLKSAGIETNSEKEIIALIAYLQRLGTDIYKTAPTVDNEEGGEEE